MAYSLLSNIPSPGLFPFSSGLKFIPSGSLPSTNTQPSGGTGGLSFDPPQPGNITINSMGVSHLQIENIVNLFVIVVRPDWHLASAPLSPSRYNKLRPSRTPRYRFARQSTVPECHQQEDEFLPRCAKDCIDRKHHDT